MKSRAEDSLAIRDATYDLSCVLNKQLGESSLCDTEKTNVKKCVESRMAECAEMCDADRVKLESLLKEIEGDIAKFNSTKGCGELTKFYSNNFIYNFCVSSSYGSCKVDKKKDRKNDSDSDKRPGKHVGGGGRGKDNSRRRDDRDDHDHGLVNIKVLRITDVLGHKRNGKNDKSSDSRSKGKGDRNKDKRRRDERSASDHKDKKFKSDKTSSCFKTYHETNLAIDIHVNFCRALDSQLIYNECIGSLTCTRAPTDAKEICADYDKHVQALIELFSKYQSDSIACIKKLEAEINTCAHDDTALLKLCK